MKPWNEWTIEEKTALATKMAKLSPQEQKGFLIALLVERDGASKADEPDHTRRINFVRHVHREVCGYWGNYPIQPYKRYDYPLQDYIESDQAEIKQKEDGFLTLLPAIISNAILLNT